MGLFGFGKKKEPQTTPQELAREINTKLRQVVGQQVAGIITPEQMEAEFLRILRDKIPRQYFAEPGVIDILTDKSGMAPEAEGWYRHTMLYTLHFLRTGKQYGEK